MLPSKKKTPKKDTNKDLFEVPKKNKTLVGDVLSVGSRKFELYDCVMKNYFGRCIFFSNVPSSSLDVLCVLNAPPFHEDRDFLSVH